MQQRLLWSMGKPLCYLGATIDEWFVLLSGFGPGLYFLSSNMIKWGFLSFIASGVMFYMFKKYKKLSVNFNLKSFLVAKRVINGPDSYPGLLGKKVGR